MIIFVGEISLVGLIVKSVLLIMVVKNGEWKVFLIQQVYIYICDFLFKKINIFENEYLFLVIFGQFVINGVGVEKVV